MPDALEDEDVLEMMNAGLLEFIVVDDSKAKKWAQVLPKIKVWEDLVLRAEGRAWGERAVPAGPERPAQRHGAPGEIAMSTTPIWASLGNSRARVTTSASAGTAISTQKRPLTIGPGLPGPGVRRNPLCGAATSMQVMRRMKGLAADLIVALPPERHESLRHHQKRLDATIARSFADAEERQDASVEDRQGLGIPRTD